MAHESNSEVATSTPNLSPDAKSVPADAIYQRGRRLAGISAIVTGGAKGIGRAICMELAGEGADVVVGAMLDMKSAERTAEEVRRLGGRSFAAHVNVTNGSSVDRFVEDVIREFGRVDLLVNNAGLSAHAPLEELQEAQWDHVFAVNTKGVFLCSVAVAKRMLAQKSGVIINIAGASAHRSLPFAGAYGPSKAAVVSLTRQMSLEWAQHGIRVNGISPGPIQELGSPWQESEPLLAEQVTRHPLHRPGSPRDVARAVVFLASSDAGYVTGHMLLVDGGGVNTWYMAPQRY